MSNRSRKGWNTSWKSGFASKAAPRPSKLEVEPITPDRTADCLSECLETFRNSVFPWDEDFDKICAVISSKLFAPLYCCDSRCGVQGLQDREEDPNVNKVIKICERFGIVVKDPGWLEAECRPESPTAASSTPIPSVEATSNNSRGSSIAPSLSQTTYQTFSASAPSWSSLAITSSLSSSSDLLIPEYTTMPASSASLIVAHGNLRMTSSATMVNHPLVTSATQSSSTKTPHSSTSPANRMSTKPISTAASPSAPTNISQSPSSLWQNMSSEAQAGLIIGLCLLAVCLVFIILYLLDRHKRRPIPSPPPTFNPRTTVDSSGIRWPEKVTLQGDAKDFHTWTRQYEKEHRFRTSLREGQYGLERGRFSGSWVG